MPSSWEVPWELDVSQMCLVEDTLHIGNLQFHRACRIMPESNKWKDGGDLQLWNMEVWCLALRQVSI